jgi:hypothetical protein
MKTSRVYELVVHARTAQQRRYCYRVETWRLARFTRDLLEVMETIREAGARFRSLSEPWADATTNAGKLIMIVFARITEFERDPSGNAPALAARRPGAAGITSDALETPSRRNSRGGSSTRETAPEKSPKQFGLSLARTRKVCHGLVNRR